MHAKRAAPAFGENREISASLRRFHHAERVFLAGHFDIDRVVAGDLEEDARVRAAFVGLTGRVQKARAESRHGRDFFVVAHRDAGSSAAPSRCAAFIVDVAEHAEVIAGLNAIEMRAAEYPRASTPPLSAAAFLSSVKSLTPSALEESAFRRAAIPFCSYSVVSFLRLDLAGFDVGLIEGVDADDRAGDRGGDFPAEEFLAEVVDVCRPSMRTTGWPAFSSAATAASCASFGSVVKPQVGEHAIVAVNRRLRRALRDRPG